MITSPSVRKREIRLHYDFGAIFYRLLWGKHLHHGLWEGRETSARATTRLTETVASSARIAHGADVLDVGCGIGGSAIYLARHLGCRVTGITLSPVQRHWAAWSALWQGVSRRTSFRCEDVEHAEFAPDSYDVIWSIECTEHLFDKREFFRRAATWLRPGGVMAICAWLVGDDRLGPSAESQVSRVCQDFLCPSLATRDEYIGWMQDAGLNVLSVTDYTKRVACTWDLCSRRIRRTGVGWLAKRVERNAARFVNGFTNIRDAYASGALRYGCLIASRPAHSRRARCAGEVLEGFAHAG